MITIAFANPKGGVAKTTTAVTLGHGLALQGRTVLVVDLDPQGHVAYALGLEKAPELYQWIVERKPLAQVGVNVFPNLDAVRGDKQSEVVKHHITTLDFRDRILADQLKNSDYEIVLLDTAASHDVLHIAALVAADWVVIPTSLDAMSVDGVHEILQTMKEIAGKGYPFKGHCILPTFFDRTTTETTTQLSELIQTYGDDVWPPIPRDTKVREAAALGRTVWEYTLKSSAVRGYSGKEGYVGGYTETLKRLNEVIF